MCSSDLCLKSATVPFKYVFGVTFPMKVRLLEFECLTQTHPVRLQELEDGPKYRQFQGLCTSRDERAKRYAILYHKDLFKRVS